MNTFEKTLFYFSLLSFITLPALSLAHTEKEETSTSTSIYENIEDEFEIFFDGSSTEFEDHGVHCIKGHENLALHIHAYMKIYVDGALDPIPAEIGLTDTCMAELHTHDATGKIHIEATDSTHSFTYQTFFDMWQRDLTRPGYTLKITLNKKSVSPTDFLQSTITLNDQIRLDYQETFSHKIQSFFQKLFSFFTSDNEKTT